MKLRVSERGSGAAFGRVAFPPETNVMLPAEMNSLFLVPSMHVTAVTAYSMVTPQAPSNGRLFQFFHSSWMPQTVMTDPRQVGEGQEPERRRPALHRS